MQNRKPDLNKKRTLQFSFTSYVYTHTHTANSEHTGSR